MRALSLLSALALLAFTGVFAWGAEPTADLQEKVEHLTVKGKIVSIRSDWLSLEYKKGGSSSYEIAIPVDDSTKLESVRNISDLQIGDTVRVTYLQKYKPGKDGKKIYTKAVATKIAFLKSAPKDTLVSKEEASDEEE